MDIEKPTGLTRSNSHLLYGATGSTKTSNCGHFANYIYEQTGKITRYIMADPGGIRPIEAKVRRLWDPDLCAWETVNPNGIIDLLDIRWAEYPMSLAQRLSSGDWPESGSIEGSRTIITFDLVGEHTWSEVGGYVIEGITTLSYAFLETLLRDGPKLSQQPSYTYTEQGPDGSPQLFHGGNQSFYGLVQNRIAATVKAFSRLPTRVLWTAHEAVAEDDTTRQTLVGPEVVGKKATSRVPSWVGDCLHLYTPPQRVAGIAKPRLYFMRHLDDTTTMPYPAKPRVPPELIPKLLERFSPEGYLEVTYESGIDEFLKYENELLEESTDLFDEWRRQVDAQRST